MRVLRALRLFRLVWLLKAGRYLTALTVLRRVVAAKRAELVMSAALTSVLLIVASSIMYFAENEAQPDKFSSIPESMWWAVATLTTVGYGDVYPMTTFGRVAGGCLAFMGIGLFALPTAILGSGLVEAVQSTRPPPACPPLRKAAALTSLEAHRDPENSAGRSSPRERRPACFTVAIQPVRPLRMPAGGGM